MKQRYVFSGTPLDENIDISNPWRDVLQATGKNTGNMFITQAVVKHLGMPKESKNFLRLDVDRINNEYDKLIIPASNFANPLATWGEKVAEHIEKIKIPIVVIGLGSQASHYSQK